jgi:hypothetical protein
MTELYKKIMLLSKKKILPVETTYIINVNDFCLIHLLNMGYNLYKK